MTCGWKTHMTGRPLWQARVYSDVASGRGGVRRKSMAIIAEAIVERLKRSDMVGYPRGKP